MRTRNAFTSLVFLLIVLTALPAAATPPPAFAWGAAFQGTEASWGTDIGVDAAGNVYSTGFFEFAVDFDPGPGAFTIEGHCCGLYVSKLDPAGGFLWAVAVGEQPWPPPEPICVAPLGCLPFVTEDVRDGVCVVPGPNTSVCPGIPLETFPYVESFALDVDSVGNVYVTGAFQGTVDFDPGPGTYEITNLGLGVGVFVLKLDTDGRFLWARGWGGRNEIHVHDVAVDEAGNVYTAGDFFEVVDFDPGPDIVPLVAVPGASDGWISKIDSSGNFVWARPVTGAGNDQVRSVDVDGAGSVLATGYYEIAAEFDPEPLAVEPLIAQWNVIGSAVDAFVWKLDGSGAMTWARSLGGNGTEVGLDAVVDDAGNVHTSGVFCSAEADFDPGAGTAILQRQGEDCNVFVSKLDPAGNYTWADGLGGIQGAAYPEGLDVTADGRVLLGGNVDGIIDFDPGPNSFQLAATSDGFLATFGSGGELLWAGLIEGSYITQVRGVALDETGATLSTGLFAGTVDLDPGGGSYFVTTPPSQYVSPVEDPFVMKLAA